MNRETIVNMKKPPVKIYRHVLVIMDIITVFAFVFVGMMTYLGGAAIHEYLSLTLIYASALSVLITGFFVIFRVYRIITTNFGLFEALLIAVIVGFAQVIGAIVILAVPNDIIPSSYNGISFVFSWLLSTIGLCLVLPSLRLIWRVTSMFVVSRRKNAVKRTLVIGAGAAAKIVIDEARTNFHVNNKVVVLVDDDVNKIGGLFSNVPVKGPISQVATIIDYYQIEEVVIAIAGLTEEKLHEILALLAKCPVRVKRMPLLSEMAAPKAKDIIEVNIEELLPRDPIKIDNHEITQLLRGNTVLVTGAGGSIGSELTRQIFATHPKTLVLFDIYENSTYDIQQELRTKMRDENIKDVELVTLIGSTYNEVRVEQVIKKYRPDYIYHAAAYKHVPLMEDSPAEAIRTNVIGTYNVARLADKYGVKKMVLVSTDKAVRPTNTMGATKRFAETIIQYFSANSKSTSYAAVRFGNVLGSNGSVVPLFEKQIEAGGPVTITHKDIIRYFMTIPEAVSLILQCSLYAVGGEIFILDMGKPVKILDLAEKLIRQSGLVPYKDIEIVETGLRPGEKLFEELLLDRETQTKTANNRIFIEEKESIYPIEDEIKEISKVFNMEETNDVKELLASIITTYTITNN